MSEPVQISVRNSLSKVIEELQKIQAQADETSEAFKGIGKEVEDGLRNNTKRTETFLENLRSMGGRVADQLRGDFKSLFAINAVSDALKISNQFKGAVGQTVELSDKVRKLGSIFGLTGQDFAAFQTQLTKGLGNIGLSSEVATRALEGLSTTPVRGQTQITEYAKTSGMLASISGETGREGDLAAQLARVIQARGGDVNNVAQMQALGESVRKAFDTTGQKPTVVLGNMEQIFARMPKDLRQSIGTQGLANLAAVSSAGGPNATKFLEQYLSMSKIQRMAIDAQGGANLLTDKGLDTKRFADFAKNITGRIGFDPRTAAQTLGIDQDAAEGFIRLAENIKKVDEAQQKINQSTGSLEEQYKSTMGAAESFRASLNRVKSMLAEPLAFATQKGTDLLSGASQSDAGAGAVVAGGGILAALLAGYGTKILGGKLGGAAGGIAGTVARQQGAEALLGEKTIPVYVTNASEIGGGGLGDAAAAATAAGGAGALSLAQKGGLVGMAALAGVGLGKIIEPYLNGMLEKTDKVKYGGMEMNAADRIGYAIARIFDPSLAAEVDERETARRKKFERPDMGARAVSPNEPAKPLRGGDTIETTPQGPIIVPAPPANQIGPQPTQSTNGTSVKSPFDQAPVRVEVYTNDPGLSVRQSPSRGASN